MRRRLLFIPAGGLFRHFLRKPARVTAFVTGPGPELPMQGFFRQTTTMLRYLGIRCLVLFLITAISAVGQDKQADLPKALIIGDSISIGYTPHVKKLLEGEVEVIHHKGNAQHTRTGLEKLDQWLGDAKWDVIHFNWGLWDLCYRNPKSKEQGNRDKVNGKITVPIDEYEKNLTELVTKLKKTDAKLIWAHTSFVPEGEAGRNQGDDRKYNDVAAKVMKENGIAINDLNALTSEFAGELFSKPGDVHYTKQGYAKIAEQVAKHIREALKE